jgi:hypothetical protein
MNRRYLANDAGVAIRQQVERFCLLYTGITRGKRLVVLVGQKKALAIAVRNASGCRHCYGGAVQSNNRLWTGTYRGARWLHQSRSRTGL